MEVFEHGPELDIIHGAFISLQHTITKNQSDKVSSFCNLDDNNIDVVASTIKRSLLMARSICAKKNIGDEKIVLRRIHAALFFKVLCGSEISCSKADQRYEVLGSYLLNLDWKLYLRIVSCCSLSHFLTDCILQLPEKIAFMLLKWTIDEIQLQGDKYLHLLNPVLHSLSHFLFKFPSHKREESSRGDSFRFNFQLAENSDSSSPPTAEELSIQVLEYLQSIQEKNSLMEMLLDWMVALIKGFCQKENICQFLNDSKEFASLCTFFTDYFSSDVFLELLKNSLNSFSYEEFKKTALLSDHFNAHPGYSLHLLFSKWRMFYSKHCCEGNSCVIIDQLEQCVEKLYSFHPLRTRNSESVLKAYLQMIIHIVNMKLDGMDYTSEMLLWDLDFRNEEAVITCIKENLDLYVQSFSRMKLLMDSAVDQRKSPLRKTELTEIFLVAYGKLTPFTQSELMRVFLKEHQLNQILKLNSYDKEFAFVFHQGTDIDELTRLVFPLCIQSPYETIEKIVSNAIKYGPHFCHSAQLLKRLEVVTTFVTKAHKSIIQRLLVYHCFLNFNDANKDNLLALIGQILKEFKSSIFSVSEFMSEVVLVHINTNLDEKALEFALQLINMCVDYTIDEDDSEWVTSFPLEAAVLLLYEMASYAVVALKGGLKEQIVTSLVNIKKLEKFRPFDYNSLSEHLYLVHPIAPFYLWDHLPFQGIDFSTWNLEALLYWWAIRREANPDIIINHMSQKTDIVNTQLTTALLQIIPHFSIAEFEHLSHLFEAPFFYSDVENDSDSSNSEEGKEMETETHKVISFTEVLVDVFILLSNASEPRLDWNYMLNAFMNTTKQCLQELTMCPLVNTQVFLEFCRLIDAIPYHVNVLSMILRDILKDLNNHDVISGEDNTYRKFLLSAVYSLPDNNKQSDLLSLF